MLISSEGVQTIGSPQQFAVRPVPTAPPGTDFQVLTAFQQETSELSRRVQSAGEEMGRARERLRFMRAALIETPRADPALFARLDALGVSLERLRTRLSGDRVRGQLNESTVPSIGSRVGRVAGGHRNTRQMPTATQRRNIEIASNEFVSLKQELSTLIETDLAQLESDLEAAGAPWTPGRRLPPR